MILGISSFTYGWSVGFDTIKAGVPMNEIDLIRQTVAFGLSCLQIGDNLPLHAISPDRLLNLKNEASGKNIQIEVGARGLKEENIENYLRIAEFLEASLVRFVIDEEEFEPANDYIIKTLKNVLPVLRSKAITLGVENHDRLNARELAVIMDAIGDEQVGICLDCVNSIGAGEGLEYVAGLLMPYTVNLHIKDFTVTRLPHQMGFTVTGCPAGQGLVNIDWLMETAGKFNRCRSAILEQWVIPEKNIAETIEREKLWAQASIDFLKRTNYFN